MAGSGQSPNGGRNPASSKNALSKMPDYGAKDPGINNEGLSHTPRRLTRPSRALDFMAAPSTLEAGPETIGPSSIPRDESADTNEPNVKRRKLTKKEKEQGEEPWKADVISFSQQINEDLPPLAEIQDMFDDMTKKAYESHLLKDAVETLGHRTINIATMCSGTEAPLLALDMIKEALKRMFNINFKVNHLFSAEIIPFKQAYIERNFHPKLLFRDIREMAETQDGKATTAYGASATIPEDVNILVAGFSCVDFSNLNKFRRGLNDDGQSGNTLRSILKYAKRYRPAIIILENVRDAPWDLLKAIWEHDTNFVRNASNMNEELLKLYDELWTDKHNAYACVHHKVDTKNYYIPQTRTRVYMFCIRRDLFETMEKAQEAVDEFGKYIRLLQRPASISVEAILLDDDDPEVRRAKLELSKPDKKTRDEIDWAICENRYLDYRRSEQLGGRRPITKWINGGTAKSPDYWWSDWLFVQVERLWDTFEIAYLRSAARGYDAFYKTRIWELSQNVDRDKDTTPFGISCCVTPCGQPFLTSRGGPLTGIEAIALQGLPVKRILLTRETQRELQDLAGNAMTSTVVGAALLSALMASFRVLKEVAKDNNLVESSERSSINAMDCSKLKVAPTEDLIKFEKTPVLTLNQMAGDSSRACFCEGAIRTINQPILVCRVCGYRGCKKCSGIPPHIFDPEPQTQRIDPQAFSRAIKIALPMTLRFDHSSGKDLKYRTQNQVKALLEEEGRLSRSQREFFESKDWDEFHKTVMLAFEGELRYQSARRSDIWTVTYKGAKSRLELVFTGESPQWFFYHDPVLTHAEASEVWRFLKNPIARMVVSGGQIFDGTWEFCLPIIQTYNINMERHGRPVNAWQASLGITHPYVSQKVICPFLKVTLDGNTRFPSRYDITGIYQRLPQCGTAMGNLHKKISPIESPSAADIFLYLDPTRIGDAQNDEFIFATEKRRLKFGEPRHPIARVNSCWRPELDKTWAAIAKIGTKECTLPTTTECYLDGYWLSVTIKLGPSEELNLATFSLPANDEDLIISPFLTQSLYDSMESAELARARARLRHATPNEWDKMTDEMLLSRLTSEEDFLDVRSQAILRAQDHNETVKNHLVNMGYEFEQGRVVKAPGMKKYQCKEAHSALVSCIVPQGNLPRQEEPWKLIKQVHEHETLAGTSWVTERIRSSWGISGVYNAIAMPAQILRCHDCAPAPPVMKWTLQKKSRKFKYYEDGRQAAAFERALKARPTPLRLQTRVDESQNLHLQIGINIPTMAHRALARFGDIPDTKGMTLEWGLNIHFQWAPEYSLRLYTLEGTNEIKDGSVAKEYIFPGVKDKHRKLLKLRLEQLDSLIWMQKQELQRAKPFLEEEIQEDIIQELGWRAVVRARKPCNVKGGVLADEVGYGKTATTLALIQSHMDYAKESASVPRPGCISLKATLIIVPLMLIRQWKGQVEKFLGKCNVLILVDVFWLNRATVKNFQDADVVITTWNVFTSEAYWTKMALLSALPKVSSHAGRGLKTWLSKATSRMRSHVEELRQLESEQENEIQDSHEGETKPQGKGLSMRKGHPKGELKPKSKPRKESQLSKFFHDLETRLSEAEDDKELLKIFPTVAADAKKALKATLQVDSPGVNKTTRHGYKAFKKANKLAELQGPSFHMFHFHRCVIDEYTYLERKEAIWINSLHAEYRWILSGTPPLNDFAGVHFMAGLVGVDLGIVDDAPGTQSHESLRQLRSDRTEVEKVLAYGQLYSPCWHQEKQDHAQRFLDHSVRQNTATYMKVEIEHHLEVIALSSPELAHYQERQQLLESNAMKLVLSRSKAQGALEEQKRSDLNGCASAPEALLKIVSHPLRFGTLQLHNGFVDPCDALIFRRLEELRELRDELRRHISRTFVLMDLGGGSDAYRNWISHVAAGQLGDPSSTRFYLDLTVEAHKQPLKEDEYYRDPPDAEEMLREKEVESLRQALRKKDRHVEKRARLDHERGLTPIPTEFARKRNMPEGEKDTVLFKKGPRSDWVPVVVPPNPPLPVKLRKTDGTIDLDKVDCTIRFEIGQLRTYAREMVSRTRALRLLKVCRKIQLTQQHNNPRLQCGRCKRNIYQFDRYWINTCCGHTTCGLCLSQPHGVKCPYLRCNAAATPFCIKTADDLTGDNSNHSKYGNKVAAIIRLIKGFPKNEKTLIFVQYTDLMHQIKAALRDADIRTWALTHQSGPRIMDTMENFQTQGKQKRPVRVLMLNASNETAAGANLTVANRVIFVSPLFVETQQQYDASIKQCIGRAHRHGQQKKVHVYRFLAQKTFDVDVFQEREHKKLVNVDGLWIMKDENEMTAKELQQDWSSGYKEKIHDDV